MTNSTLWSTPGKVKNILCWPFQSIINFIKLILKVSWLILQLIISLTKRFINHILPQTTSNSSQTTSSQNEHHEPKTLLAKLLQFKLSDLQFKLAIKITSLQQSIPKTLSKWFPQNKKSQYKKPAQLSIQELRKSSNQVLVDIKTDKKAQQKSLKKQSLQQAKSKQSRVYYVPTYLRVKVKNITAIDLDKLQAEVNADVIVSFVYGVDQLIKIPKQVAVRLLNQVVLNFQRDQSLKLDQKDNVHISTKQQVQKYHIQFTVRKKLHMRIQSRVYYTPFEQLYLILPITIQQLTPKTVSAKQFNQLTEQYEEVIYDASIKFNYMDNEGAFVKLDFTDEKHFGYYSLIETGLMAKYSNQRITSIEDLDKYANKKPKSNCSKDEDKSGEKKEISVKVERKEEKKQARIQPKNQEKLPLINKKEENHKIIKRKPKKSQKSQNLQKEETKSYLKPPMPSIAQKDKKASKSQKQQGKSQLKYFQYSFFKIPIYKHPMASLVVIFLPLWSLAIINLGIFFQQNSLSQRIASIASLMIAFIALNQTIRSQIPPHPRVVFVQLLVYAQMIACFLCLMNSYQVSQIQNYRMVWTQCKLFLIALTIFIVEVVIIFVMGLYHYYVMVPSYQLAQKKPKFDKINTRNWRNKQCDEHFEKLIQKTNSVIEKHNRGMNESKKLKDVMEQLSEKSQKQPGSSSLLLREQVMKYMTVFSEMSSNMMKKTQSFIMEDELVPEILLKQQPMKQTSQRKNQ